MAHAARYSLCMNAACPNPLCGSTERETLPPEPADPTCGIMSDTGALEVCRDCGHVFSEGPNAAECEDAEIECAIEFARGN